MSMRGTKVPEIDMYWMSTAYTHMPKVCQAVMYLHVTKMPGAGICIITTEP